MQKVSDISEQWNEDSTNWENYRQNVYDYDGEQVYFQDLSRQPQPCGRELIFLNADSNQILLETTEETIDIVDFSDVIATGMNVVDSFDATPESGYTIMDGIEQIGYHDKKLYTTNF